MNPKLYIEINLFSNHVLAMMYWELWYSGFEHMPQHSELKKSIIFCMNQLEKTIRSTYSDEEVYSDFMESVRREVV